MSTRSYVILFLLSVSTPLPADVPTKPRFGPPKRIKLYPSGSGYYPIEVLNADLDNDGDQDLVVALVKTTPTPYTYYLRTLSNDGGGTFTLRSWQSVGNLGYGAFTGPAPDNRPLLSRPMAVGDITGDGLPDIVLVDIVGVSTSKLKVYKNLGNFSFSNTYNATANDLPSSIAMVDWDLDDKLDVLAGARNGLTEVAFYKGENASNGKLTPTTSYIVLDTPHYISELVTADFNEDGNPDAAVSIREGATSTLCMGAVLLGNGLGGVSQTITTPFERSGMEGIGLKTGYIDTDTHLDLAFCTFTQVIAFENRFDQGGTFSYWTYQYNTAVKLPYEILIGNWDNDSSGIFDLITGNEDLSAAGGVSYYENLYATWWKPTTLGDEYCDIRSDGDGHHGMIIEDLVGDSELDLVVTCFNQEAIVILEGFKNRTTFVKTILSDVGPVAVGQKVYVYGGGLNAVTGVKVQDVWAYGFEKLSDQLLRFAIPDNANCQMGRRKLTLITADETYEDPLGLTSLVEDDVGDFAYRARGDADADGDNDSFDVSRLSQWIISRVASSKPPIMLFTQIDDSTKKR